jgi:TRAP-type C4-dicarboxylate transport system permease small subunit
MALLAFYQVVTRYIFTSLSLPWIEEMVRHLFVAITFIGAAVLTRKKQHPGVEILSRVIPNRIKPYHELYSLTFSLIFSALASYASLQLVLKQKAVNLLTVATRIPLYVLTIPVFLGFALITYYLLRDLIVVSRDLLSGKKRSQ